MTEVTGRVALITGGAGGIGGGIARAGIDSGMRVAIADIDLERARTCARDLDPSGDRAMPVALDIRDREQWQSAVLAIEARFSRIDVLCNNAGVAPAYSPIDELDPQAWDLMVQVNLTGAFNGVRAVLPRIKAHGQGGHIVNVASMSGLFAQAGLADYAAAKFGLVGFSDAIRAELAGQRIGVTVVCPGAVKSLLWKTSRQLRGQPGLDTPPESSMKGSASPFALDPQWVGRRVLQAIRDNEPYVVTHADRLADIRARSALLEEAFGATSRYLRANPVRPAGA